jgi:hypothetical protein
MAEALLTLQEHLAMLACVTGSEALTRCACKWRETTNAWVRTATDKDCPEHGEAAMEAYRRGRLRSVPAVSPDASRTTSGNALIAGWLRLAVAVKVARNA